MPTKISLTIVLLLSLLCFQNARAAFPVHERKKSTFIAGIKQEISSAMSYLENSVASVVQNKPFPLPPYGTHEGTFKYAKWSFMIAMMSPFEGLILLLLFQKNYNGLLISLILLQSLGIYFGVKGLERGNSQKAFAVLGILISSLVIGLCIWGLLTV